MRVCGAAARGLASAAFGMLFEVDFRRALTHHRLFDDLNTFGHAAIVATIIPNP